MSTIALKAQTNFRQLGLLAGFQKQLRICAEKTLYFKP